MIKTTQIPIIQTRIETSSRNSTNSIKTITITRTIITEVVETILITEEE